MATSDLLTTIANNVPLVFEAGKTEGIKEMEPQLEEKYEEGYAQGFAIGKNTGKEEGKQVERNDFWEIFQAKGTPTRYYWRFAYNWNNNIYNPKYDIVGMNASNALGNTFYSSGITDTKVAIDATRVPTGLDATFYWARKLQRIRKLVITENTTFKQSFTDCSALISIDEIEGKIGQNINLKDCVLLNKRSIEILVEALSTNTTELTLTLSAEAVENAFTNAEWEVLEATKTNWNISLV